MAQKYEGCIKQIKFGTICEFEGSFNVACCVWSCCYSKPPEENRHLSYHVIFTGIKSSIIYDTRYRPLLIYVFLKHIKYHIDIGVILNAYGELSEDITSYSDSEAVAATLGDSDERKRIDIFVHDLAAIIKLKIGMERNENCWF